MRGALLKARNGSCHFSDTARSLQFVPVRIGRRSARMCRHASGKCGNGRARVRHHGATPRPHEMSRCQGFGRRSCRPSVLSAVGLVGRSEGRLGRIQRPTPPVAWVGRPVPPRRSSGTAWQSRRLTGGSAPGPTCCRTARSRSSARSATSCQSATSCHWRGCYRLFSREGPPSGCPLGTDRQRWNLLPILLMRHNRIRIARLLDTTVRAAVMESIR
jgi:hypothetical protein